MRRPLFALAAVVLILDGCVESRRSSYSRTSYHPPAPAPPPNTVTVPEDTAFDVKLHMTLDSGTPDRPATREGTRFTSTVVRGVAGAIPPGATVKGRVDDVKHMINRTSMRLVFDEIVLPDGRRASIFATPKSGSKIDVEEIKDKGADAAKDFLVERGIDAITAGVLAPLWVAQKVVKGYDFVTKEERMILPEGSVVTIKLRAAAHIPRT
ncbi:MAG: hypothetical protein AB1696_18940 [Planctomycetota bacterium]